MGMESLSRVSLRTGSTVQKHLGIPLEMQRSPEVMQFALLRMWHSKTPGCNYVRRGRPGRGLVVFRGPIELILRSLQPHSSIGPSNTPSGLEQRSLLPSAG